MKNGDDRFLGQSLLCFIRFHERRSVVDGITDRAIINQTTFQWYVICSSSGNGCGGGIPWGWQWNGMNDLSQLALGDYDGDGKTDLALYRPSSGYWYVLLSSTNYTGYSTYQWGIAGDIGVPGDYDGDGNTDLGLYRPSAGTWYILLSSTNYTAYHTYQWGINGDIPILQRR